jgi:heterodisulfide reductase subunit A
MCIVSPKLVEVARHIDIETITNTELSSLTGEAGNFKAVLTGYPRYIDLEKCTGCGICRWTCPVRAVNDNYGLDRRAATYIRYSQAVPLAYAIDRTPASAAACEKVCLAKAIKYGDEVKKRELRWAWWFGPGFSPIHAVCPVMVTGIPNIVSSMEFERPERHGLQGMSCAPTTDEPTKIAWLQCVGSRDEKPTYCSSVC